MKKLIFVFIFVVVSVMQIAKFDDFMWSINYAGYEPFPWYNTKGEWKNFKTVKLEKNMVLNRSGKVIGHYWFNHQTNLIIKIDSPKLKFYSSVRFMDNSTCMCGIGEIWGNGEIKIIKIIMYRKYKWKKK